MKNLKPICCSVCSIAKARTSIVMGRGELPADILFIGEAPGRSEDLLGEAFVGDSGKLLDEMMKDAMRVARIPVLPSYFITNTILCRPFVEDDTDEDFGKNREPNQQEILNCMQNVMRISRLVKPRIVVFIGKISKKYYSKEFKLSGSIQHPAFLLRQGGKTSEWYPTNIRNLASVFERLKK